ncbi:MAG: bifunctional adenosylcobinamide kinase/adenosylcobinamide-phosphate guanylyltransferase [Prevotellaceae bacterium]|nr:bifunctional adenosylcobinamide kinase/adenosylcobinamide-phosphate guanylyltransferase [Prevotellaceae bacterium]
MKRIIMVTGGARSGKSSYAERLALGLSASPVYMATARVWDDEFRRRIDKHRERRGARWRNIEEEKALGKHRVEGETVVVDCLTLWATNFFFDLQADVDSALTAIKAEFDRFTAQEATFIFVTNEIGMGGTSQNALQRKFTDLMGWVNQYVAARADEVILMVSGIPVQVKGETSGRPSLALGDGVKTAPTMTDNKQTS